MTIDLKRLCNLAQSVEERAVKAHKQLGGGDWFRVRNYLPEVTQIYIYDIIGEYGVTRSDFQRAMNEIRTPEIELHVASEGGSVWDGIAIYNSLKNHPAYVRASIDSIAASAASFIVMAADEIEIEKSARMMIHDASGLCIGNAKEMRKLADELDEITDTIAEIYSDRAGGDKKAWRKLMDQERFFDAQQAVEAGLADRIAGTRSPANTMSARINNVQATERVVTLDTAALVNAIKEGIK